MTEWRNVYSRRESMTWCLLFVAWHQSGSISCEEGLVGEAATQSEARKKRLFMAESVPVLFWEQLGLWLPLSSGRGSCGSCGHWEITQGHKVQSTGACGKELDFCSSSEFYSSSQRKDGICSEKYIRFLVAWFHMSYGQGVPSCILV